MCNDCAICYEPLFPNSSNVWRLKKKVLVKRCEKLPITKLKCGHLYHKTCIRNWFNKVDMESSTKCPLCRDKIIFKPDSRDLMMHKIRHNDKKYQHEHVVTILETTNIPTYTFRFPSMRTSIDDDGESEFGRELVSYADIYELDII